MKAVALTLTFLVALLVGCTPSGGGAGATQAAPSQAAPSAAPSAAEPTKPGY